jgi:hypothetical protein
VGVPAIDDQRIVPIEEYTGNGRSHHCARYALP